MTARPGPRTIAACWTCAPRRCCFNITDDIGGHTIHEMRDSNWVNFFAVTATSRFGSIDTGYSGSISLNTTGAIRDAMATRAQLLASSVYLYAGRAVGATGWAIWTS